MKVHYSSKKHDWETPDLLFDKINYDHGPFTTDVCATFINSKCKHYYDEETDGLAISWSGICWMNPPYGRGIGKWIKKAYEESLKGCKVVCLLPARTDTKWFHEYCIKGKVEFLKGRLTFKGAKYSAPFPSMVVIFG